MRAPLAWPDRVSKEHRRAGRNGDPGTGGTGFVGLNLVEALLARGDRVVILSNQPLPQMAEPAFARLPGRLTLVTGDVRDARLVGDAVKRHAVERIVHGAAVTADRRREARSPALILEVNLLGLVHILEAARAAGVLRVVLIGSAAAYGQRLWQEQRLSEEASVDPDTLYSISKAASEQILWRLGDLYRLSVVVGRLATVFGPFEWPGGWRDTPSPILQVTDIARAGGRALLPRDDRRDWLPCDLRPLRSARSDSRYLGQRHRVLGHLRAAPGRERRERRQ